MEAIRCGRKFIGIEVNEEYLDNGSIIKMQKKVKQEDGN